MVDIHKCVIHKFCIYSLNIGNLYATLRIYLYVWYGNSLFDIIIKYIHNNILYK